MKLANLRLFFSLCACLLETYNTFLELFEFTFFLCFVLFFPSENTCASTKYNFSQVIATEISPKQLDFPPSPAKITLSAVSDAKPCFWNCSYSICHLQDSCNYVHFMIRKCTYQTVYFRVCHVVWLFSSYLKKQKTIIIISHLYWNYFHLTSRSSLAFTRATIITTSYPILLNGGK